MVFKIMVNYCNYWLKLGGKAPQRLRGFCDADGRMTEGHKAINGYIFQLGQGTISWSSKRQNLVPLSVYEGELQALAYATQEAIWLKHFVGEVLQTNPTTITIYSDNEAAIHTVKREEMTFNMRTKHLDLRKDFVRCYIDNGYIDVKYVRTENQPADLLTKTSEAKKLKHLIGLMNLGQE